MDSWLIANAEELYHQGTGRALGAPSVSTPARSRGGLDWEVSSPGETPSPLGGLNEFAKGVFNAPAPSKASGIAWRPSSTSAADENMVHAGPFASPVHYQHSGIMTFSLGRDGSYFQ